MNKTLQHNCCFSDILNNKIFRGFLKSAKKQYIFDIHEIALSGLTINLTIKCRQTIHIFPFRIHRCMHIAI